jgi:hypothetical protein
MVKHSAIMPQSIISRKNGSSVFTQNCRFCAETLPINSKQANKLGKAALIVSPPELREPLFAVDRDFRKKKIELLKLGWQQITNKKATRITTNEEEFES